MKQDVVIYHNGRCSKSRGALEILKELGIDPEIRLYLSEPLSREELKTLLKKLRLKPSDIIRKNEKVFKEQFSDTKFGEEEWLQALLDYPQLMERPIVSTEEKAIIARPPENIIDWIKQQHSR